MTSPLPPPANRRLRRALLPTCIRESGLLLLMALTAVLVQGYHFGTEDAGIYVPAITRFAHPNTFPFGEEFFLSHGHASIFAALAGGAAHLFHCSVALSVLLWYLLGTWLLLLAGWQMARLCFADAAARWAAVGMLAAVLPVQVAGTAIPIMDNYFTARSLSTPLTLLALTAGLRGRWRGAIICLGFTLFLHPQMTFYAAVLLAGIALPQFWEEKSAHAQQVIKALPVALVSIGSFGSLSSMFPSGPASGPYREAVYSRTFFFAGNWDVIQWIGVFCPLLILIGLSSYPLSTLRPAARRLCATLVAAGVLATILFLVFSSSARFNSLVRLQPMRIFQLLYIVMFLLLGGLLGQYFIRGRVLRAIAVYLPLALGMFALDRYIYPQSPHLELPECSSSNPWLQAFRWIRQNTPQDAVFALDPEYLHMRGEDGHGFRALTERSVLADEYKDSGVAAMFPAVAPEWGREVQAQQGWRGFRQAQFQQLAAKYPVTWVVVSPAQDAGLECPYHNQTLSVCRIPIAALAADRDAHPAEKVGHLHHLRGPRALVSSMNHASVLLPPGSSPAQ